MLHQRIIAFDLVRFAAGHVEGYRVTFSVRAEVDFRREEAEFAQYLGAVHVIGVGPISAPQRLSFRLPMTAQYIISMQSH